MNEHSFNPLRADHPCWKMAQQLFMRPVFIHLNPRVTMSMFPRAMPMPNWVGALKMVDETEKVD